MAELNSSSTVKTGIKHVVEKVLADFPTGIELDMTGLTAAYSANDDYIPEGTPIILDTTYKPLQAANLVADGPKIVGYLFREIPVSLPHAAVVIAGVVNEDKLPFALDTAAKAATPGIQFVSYS